jgi:ABC-type Zn2+ transport system substrate-binding protein/surface adhesin
MSDVIDFLEKWGRDAQLRHATSTELVQALAGTQIDPFMRKALVGADRRHLEFLVGAQANVCSLIFVPEEEEEEQDEEKEEEEEQGDDAQKDDKVKSQDCARRRA